MILNNNMYQDKSTTLNSFKLKLLKNQLSIQSTVSRVNKT